MSTLVSQSANRLAFKEWAAVCAALAAGRQTIILRKGGIAEGPDGFQPEHSEFWLLPTRFHQRPAALHEADRHFFDQAQAESPPEDRLRIEHYAVVAEAIELTDPDCLPALESLHVYGESTVRERFVYRRPGLFLLAVRIYRAPRAVEIPVWPELAGCHSWVELPEPLGTAGLQLVLGDEEFAQRLAEIRRAVC